MPGLAGPRRRLRNRDGLARNAGDVERLLDALEMGVPRRTPGTVIQELAVSVAEVLQTVRVDKADAIVHRLAHHQLPEGLLRGRHGLAFEVSDQLVDLGKHAWRCDSAPVALAIRSVKTDTLQAFGGARVDGNGPIGLSTCGILGLELTAHLEKGGRE